MQVTQIGKEEVQKAFPTLVFSLNSVNAATAGSFAYTPAQCKLARQIAAIAFVGSQKKDKKTKKLLAKKTAKEQEKVHFTSSCYCVLKHRLTPT